MTERIDIANLALGWQGNDPITSLEDESERAHQMRINYIPARDATLEAHEWSFAIERFIPGLLEDEPAFGDLNAFSVPPEILRVISVTDGETGALPFALPIGSAEQLDWVMEGGNILAREEVIYARGIRRIEQEGMFSPLFVHAFAGKLAYLTALTLTASAEIQANMLGIYTQQILEAKTRDGLQGRTRTIRNRQLIKSR
jgi:hypothetical protein